MYSNTKLLVAFSSIKVRSVVDDLFGAALRDPARIARLAARHGGAVRVKKYISESSPLHSSFTPNYNM